MKILNIRALSGPNVWLYRPVLIMQLDLEELDERESYEPSGFIERLVALLPGLHEHGCDTGDPGRFVERLYLGTYFGHVTEHVAIELTNLAGFGVNFGKTRASGRPRVYNVIVEYRSEQATRYLLEAAVDLVTAVLAGEEFSVEAALAEARRIREQTDLGPSTGAIAEAAERRGIPYRRLDDDSLIELGYGIYRKHVQTAMTSQTSTVGVEVAGDKELTKKLLRDAFIPVPASYLVTTAEEAVKAWQELGGQVVIKPVDGKQGKGVSLGLDTAERVARAFNVAHQFSATVMVEEHVFGNDYRVLTVNGRVVAASERRPGQVLGDGQHTVAELVEIANQDPLRGEGHDRPLSRICLDEVALACLDKQALALEAIPLAGQVVLLRENANLSTGGTAADVTDVMHPDTVALCERAARLLGLDICGIDLVTTDISQPLARGTGAILELNAAPGLRMHLYPSSGRRREVGEAIVDMLYPPGAPSRIPIIAITGTNGKTTVARMTASILRAAGLRVGLTTTDAIYIDGEKVAAGDMTGPASARAVLSDPTVEAAVLETARGGIVRGGLGYDWSDVAVITNIQADHIGQDGIENIGDLIKIKSLIAERVRRGGTVILNADEHHAAGIAELERVVELPRQIVFFALSPRNRLVLEHVEQGGTAYYVREGWLAEMAGGIERRIIRVTDVPAAMGGMAEFNISNALAAVAAARAQGVLPATIFSALASFDINQDNPGRMNFFQVGRGYLMLDYGHNPHALGAVARMTAGLREQGRRVTGLLGLPGDRADWLMETTARVAAHAFDRLIVREDLDLRGREPGEVPDLIYAAVMAESPGLDCQVIRDEAAALQAAIESMEDGEVIVCFYDEMDPIQEMLQAQGARPVSGLQDLPVPVDYRSLHQAGRPSF